MKVKITPWPNGLGFEATVNRTTFDIWGPKAFPSRPGHIAQQTRKDDSLCGYAGIRWRDIGEAHLSPESAALVAYAELKARPEQWTACA